MLGRKQEINLQLTELLDSILLAVAFWFSHFIRSKVLQTMFPGLEEVAPFSDFFWVMAVIVPFTPKRWKPSSVRCYHYITLACH